VHHTQLRRRTPSKLACARRVPVSTAAAYEPHRSGYSQQASQLQEYQVVRFALLTTPYAGFFVQKGFSPDYFFECDSYESGPGRTGKMPVPLRGFH